MTAVRLLLIGSLLAGLGLAISGVIWLMGDVMSNPEQRSLGTVGLVASSTLVVMAIPASIGVYVGFAARSRRLAGRTGFDWDAADRIAHPLFLGTATITVVGAVVCFILTSVLMAVAAAVVGGAVVAISAWQIGLRSAKRGP
jgi:hypothetical protein